MIKFLRYRPAFRLAFIYAVVAALWVEFSNLVLNTALNSWVPDPTWRGLLHTIKDGVFIVATALMIYLLMKQELTRRKEVQEELRRRNVYLDSLHETTLALMNRLDLNDLLTTVVSKAGKLMDTQHGYVDLVVPGTSQLESWGGTGVFKDYAGFRKKLGEGLGGKVWKTGQPQVVDDYDAWSGRVPGFKEGVFRALVGAPLKSNSRVVGVLALAYVEPGRKFTPGQVKLLSGFAELATLALDNARLYTTVQTELSERRKAEAELKAAEVKYRALVEQIPAVIYTLSIKDRGTMLYISPQVEKILGFPAHDWLNDSKLWLNTLYPADRERVLNEMSQGQTGRALFSSEYRMFTRTGQVKWIHDEAVLVRDEIGEPQFIQGIMRDITEQKQAEEALQASEARVRLIVDSIPEGIYGLDLRGNCTFANAACVRLLGYERQEDLLGKNMHSLIHHTRADGTPYPVTHSRIYTAFQTGQGVYVDNEVLWRADGASFPAEYWAYPVQQGEFVVGGVVTFIDITERRRVEEEMRRTAVRTTLLAEVSHALAKAGFEVPVVLETAARYIATLLGDSCSIHMLSDDGQELKAVALYHPNPETLALLRNLLAAAPSNIGEGPVGRVIQTGQPLLLAGEALEAIRREVSPAHLAYLEYFGLHSMLVVPLRLQGHTIGALTVSRQTPGSAYNLDDQFFLQELADRVALACANARLFDMAHQELAERQRMEEALSENERTYRLLLEEASDGIFISDQQGNYLIVNSRGCTMLGYTHQELLRLNVRDVVAAEDEASPPLWFDELRAGKTVLSERRLRRKDGALLTVEISAKMLPNGTLQAIVRDVAEREQVLKLHRLSI